MIDPSSARDLLSNFETWPAEVQASFLEMFGQAMAIEAEVRTQASLSMLDMLIRDFRQGLLANRNETRALLEEINQSEALEQFLREMHQSGDLVILIDEISEQHRRLNELMLKLAGKK